MKIFPVPPFAVASVANPVNTDPVDHAGDPVDFGDDTTMSKLAQERKE